MARTPNGQISYSAGKLTLGSLAIPRDYPESLEVFTSTQYSQI
jgi:hypothetical protein